MPDDREKLLAIMGSLESDYKAGKISREKYNYFHSKYQDKLNSIDAQAATRRIRSMQGKPSSDTTKKKRSRKPAKNKKEQEDLVQKYIINPKKDDAKYNKKEKSSMDSGTFKLVLILVLVIGFTVGVAYGVFNFDFDSVSDTSAVAIVEDTAFPEFNEDIIVNTTASNVTFDDSDDSDDSDEDIETTQDNSYSDNSQTNHDNSQSGGSGSSSGSGSGSGSSSGSGSGSGSSSGGQSGSSDSGGGEE